MLHFSQSTPSISKPTSLIPTPRISKIHSLPNDAHINPAIRHTPRVTISNNKTHQLTSESTAKHQTNENKRHTNENQQPNENQHPNELQHPKSRPPPIKTNTPMKTNTKNLIHPQSKCCNSQIITSDILSPSITIHHMSTTVMITMIISAPSRHLTTFKHSRSILQPPC